jgi:hypothetical protein
LSFFAKLYSKNYKNNAFRAINQIKLKIIRLKRDKKWRMDTTAENGIQIVNTGLSHPERSEGSIFYYYKTPQKIALILDKHSPLTINFLKKRKNIH